MVQVMFLLSPCKAHVMGGCLAHGLGMAPAQMCAFHLYSWCGCSIVVLRGYAAVQDRSGFVPV